MIIIIRRNRSSASEYAYSYTFLRSVVCRLSLVCHTRAPYCVYRFTDLDAIRQVHSWGPVAHTVRSGSLTPRGREDSEVEPRAAKTRNSKLRIAAATWRIERKFLLSGLFF